MKGDVLLQNIQVTGFIPATAGKNVKDGKRKIKEAVETKLGKNIDNVRKRCDGKPLWVNVAFYLQKDSAHAKKDLDSLSNVLLAVLSTEMSSGKDAEPGLGIIKDDSVIYKIVFEKKIVESEKDEGLSFSIYEWAYS
ncbi:hypothetical protein [Candidatus Nitrosotenuis cloacae]|jgi:hypothetical protein|uniref:hypothetical protein n=1 Tax=Candidatus Nitrosotenuis cloacae TaxID=1603555 RepID=UPI00227DB0FE|nr:hypothetical protein [Candidatus Nitrosotenuis cloacae]